MAESATQTYSAAVATLQEEETRLATLKRRRESGEKLSRNDFVDMLQLEGDVAHARQQVEAATPAMAAEQLALDVADVVEVSQSLLDPHVQAFQAFVEAVATLWSARQRLLDAHQAHSEVLNGLPAYRHLGLSLIPTGEETFRNILSRMPDAGAWMQIFLSPHSAPLTVGQAKEMFDVYAAARPPTAGSLTRHVQAQRQAQRRG